MTEDMTMVTTSVRLPLELFLKLKEAKAERKETFSAMVARALEKYLADDD